MSFLSSQRQEPRYNQGAFGALRFYKDVLADLVSNVFTLRTQLRRSATAGSEPPGEGPGRARAESGREAGLFDGFFQDIRWAYRGLIRSPLFTLTAVVTLALGIGANAAMFSTVHNVLLKPLPFLEPNRLVIGLTAVDNRTNPRMTGADYYDYRERADLFEHLAAYWLGVLQVTVTGVSEPERVGGTVVSPNLFPALGVDPQLGRNFTFAEGRADAPGVVLISHSYWQRRFGESPDVIDKTLTINGNQYSIVGVMPAGFRLTPNVDIWSAMRPDRNSASDRRFHNWRLVGRLRAGVSIEQAQSQVDVIASQLEGAYPETNEGKRLVLRNMHDELVAGYRTQLYMLTVAVGLILLIACGNVMGMLLARAPTRRIELSVRAALGAPRVRLVRQLLTEAVLLSAVGGVIGTVCAVWMRHVVLEFMRMSLPGLDEGSLSIQTLAFAVTFAAIAGLMAGVYPAVSGARGKLADDLKAGFRTVVGGGTRFRTGLVVAQVAVSIVLLIGSALLIRSFSLVRSVDPGFDPGNLLTAGITLPRGDYPDLDSRIHFFNTLLDHVHEIPGVSAAGLINHLPIRSPYNTFRVYLSNDHENERVTHIRSVFPGYFEVMRVPQVNGRSFEESDSYGAPRVAVINKRLAETFFPDLNPVGRQLALDEFGDEILLDIIGVVGNVHVRGLNLESDYVLYLPYPQSSYSSMEIVVRTDVEPSAVARAVRNAVQRLDGDIPLAGLATMRDLLAESVSERKIIAFSLTVYAMLPLVLAAVGLYAVLAFYVNQRFREIGVRIALGAAGRHIGRMILLRGITLVASGVALGVAGAVGLTRLIRQFLFGVEPTDVPTFAGVVGFVAVIALVACMVPAWRAVRVDPMVALRRE